MTFAELGLRAEFARRLEAKNITTPSGIQTEVFDPIRTGNSVVGYSKTGTGKTFAYMLPLVERLATLVAEESAPPKPEADAELKSDPISEANADVTHEAKSDTSEVSETNADAPDAPVATAAETNTAAIAPKSAPRAKGPLVLVLVPTRELATQVARDVELVAGHVQKHVVIVGGESEDQQIEAGRQADWVIATPGRMLDLLKRRAINLSTIRGVVFDEADRLLDMGFVDDMRAIMRLLPPQLQLLFFSATIHFGVDEMAYEFGSAEILRFGKETDELTVEGLDHRVSFVGDNEKFHALAHYIHAKDGERGIVFSNYRDRAHDIAMGLRRLRCHAEVLTAQLSQSQRTRIMESFRKGDTQVLVASDLAARGLDVFDIDFVVNFDLPEDPATYVHRVGRTARAGRKGQAVSFVGFEDAFRLEKTEKFLGKAIERYQFEVEKLTGPMPQFKGPELPRAESAMESDDRYGGNGGRNFGGNAGGGRGGNRDRGPRGGGRGEARDFGRGPRQGPPRDGAGNDAAQGARLGNGTQGARPGNNAQGARLGNGAQSTRTHGVSPRPSQPAVSAARVQSPSGDKVAAMRKAAPAAQRGLLSRVWSGVKSLFGLKHPGADLKPAGKGPAESARAAEGSAVVGGVAGRAPAGGVDRGPGRGRVPGGGRGRGSRGGRSSSPGGAPRTPRTPPGSGGGNRN